MKLFRTLTRLTASLVLVIASGLSAELLTLEENGTSQIIAKIRATMNAEAIRTGSLIPWEFSYRSEGADKIVQVLSPVPLTVKMDGKRTDINLYNVKINDNKAVLTMASEDDAGAGEHQMVIGYSSEMGDHGVRYQVNFSATSVDVQEDPPEHPKQMSNQTHKIDVEVATPEAFLPGLQDINTARTSTANQPLTIYVFKHQDVKENVSSLIHEHFSWWATHMDTINQRHQNNGNIALFSEVVVDFRSDNTIQQFEYEGEPEDKLYDLAGEFRRYKRDNGIVGSYRRNKFLLLTEKMLDWKTLGIAYVGGQYGIAADDDDQVAAHEIGHMLGGQHNEAEVVYNGWWCESILYWQHFFLRAGCHTYTDDSMDTISSHLKY